MIKNVKLSGTVAALAILLFEGCALINPHVTWQRPDPPLTLDQAIKYANDGREAYKQGVATYTTVPNVLAMTLIPLGAGTIGAGIGGAHPTTIGYLALAGAGAFTLGQWFQNPLRQDVYIAGMNGITCAVEAVLPLKIDRAQLLRGLENMRQHAATAEGHAREVARLVAEFDFSGATAQSKAAAQSLTSAKEVFDRAQQAFGDGHALSDLNGRAGELLSAKIADIDTLVTKQLKSTQRDTESLRVLIKGLGETARTLVPLSGKAAELLAVGVPEAPGFKPQARSGEPDTSARGYLEKQLDRETNAMNLAVGALSVEARRVQSIVDSAVRSKPSETLKLCGVEEVKLSFTLDPSTSITLPQGKIVTVTAIGGTGPFQGTLEPQPAEGVTLLPPKGTDRTFTLVADAKAPPAPYNLRIEDALHNVQRINITVVDPNAATRAKLQDAVKTLMNKKQDVVEAGGRFTVDSAELSDDGQKVKVKLKVAKAPTSPPSESKLKNTLSEFASLSGEQIEIANYSDIKTPLAVPPANAVQSCTGTDVFNTAAAVERKRIQGALCLTGTAVDGIWGCQTENAFKVYQKRNGLKEDGILIPDVKNQLLKLTDQQIAAQCTVPGPASSLKQPPGAENQPGAGAKTAAKPGTPLAVDPQKLTDFARAIQGQNLGGEGVKIVVGIANVDVAKRIVTVKIIQATNSSGGTVDNSQIIQALIKKGDGVNRGVWPENIELTR